MAKLQEVNREVKIIQIDFYFVYLPFYYATSNKFWSSKLDNYRFSYTNDLAKTDKQVIERLMNSNGSDIVFAIADPASIFEYQAQHDAKDIVILAALLTNAAFWAVDHDNHTVENLQHLDQFDKIVAYGEGTTSHRIARTINPQKTQSVPPKTEIEVLTQGNRQESVIVLTPDLVGLEKTLFNNNEYQVKLNVGSTTEFDEVLITALITRRDVINHHPELVKEVLKGIQRACYLVQIDDEGSVEFADHFAALHPLQQKTPETEEILRSALNRANCCRVFPAAITITEAQWKRAAQAFWRSKGEEFTQEVENTAKRIYENNIQPYCDYSRNATKAVLRTMSKVPIQNDTFTLRQILSIMSNLPNHLKYLLIPVLLILAILLIRGSYSIIIDFKNWVLTLNPSNPSPINPDLSPPIQEMVSVSMRLKWRGTNEPIQNAYITFFDGAKPIEEAATRTNSEGNFTVFLPKKTIKCEVKHQDLFNKIESFDLLLISHLGNEINIPEKQFQKRKN